MSARPDSPVSPRYHQTGGEPGEAQLSAESWEEPVRLDGRLVELARPVRRHVADDAARRLPAAYTTNPTANTFMIRTSASRTTKTPIAWLLVG